MKFGEEFEELEELAKHMLFFDVQLLPFHDHEFFDPSLLGVYLSFNLYSVGGSSTRFWCDRFGDIFDIRNRCS